MTRAQETCTLKLIPLACFLRQILMQVHKVLYSCTKLRWMACVRFSQETCREKLARGSCTSRTLLYFSTGMCMAILVLSVTVFSLFDTVWPSYPESLPDSVTAGSSLQSQFRRHNHYARRRQKRERKKKREKAEKKKKKWEKTDLM